MFNVPELTKAAVAAIEAFAGEHSGETFYAFAVDADMLCFNSIEQFEKTLALYQQDYPDFYASARDIRGLRENTGDWAYQGFFQMDESHGFDGVLYDEHYDEASAANDGRAANTPYASAMDELVASLKQSHAFKSLNLTSDFTVAWVDHNY